MAKLDGLNQIMAGTVTSADLATPSGTATSYGSASQIPVFSINAQGQVTVVTATALGLGSTAGSVIFTGASGVLSQNSAKLFWDNTNFRLGIGTATPSYTLDVAGTLNVSSTLTLPASTAAQPTLVFGSGGVAPTTAASGQLWYDSTSGASRLPFIDSGTNTRDLLMGGAYTFYRNLPTTVNNYVEIGYFNSANGPHNLLISVLVNAPGYSTSKLYNLSVKYNQSGWAIVQPIKDSGSYSGNDTELNAYAVNNILYLRLRRTAGSTAGTATIRILDLGQPSQFTPTSATGTDTTTTGYFGQTTPTGLGYVNQVAVFNAATSLGGSSSLTWDGTTFGLVGNQTLSGSLTGTNAYFSNGVGLANATVVQVKYTTGNYGDLISIYSNNVITLGPFYDRSGTNTGETVQIRSGAGGSNNLVLTGTTGNLSWGGSSVNLPSTTITGSQTISTTLGVTGIASFASAVNASAGVYANSGLSTQQTSLNPPITVYGTQASNPCGFDLGYLSTSTRFRLRGLVGVSNEDFSWAVGQGTTQASFSELMTLRGDSGALLIGSNLVYDGITLSATAVTATPAKLQVNGVVLAKQGAPYTGGYSFIGDGGLDTGMFSASDGDLKLYSNGTIILHNSTNDVAINNNLTVGGSQTVAGAGSFGGSLTAVGLNLGFSTITFADSSHTISGGAAPDNGLTFTGYTQIGFRLTAGGTNPILQVQTTGIAVNGNGSFTGNLSALNLQPSSAASYTLSGGAGWYRIGVSTSPFTSGRLSISSYSAGVGDLVVEYSYSSINSNGGTLSVVRNLLYGSNPIDQIRISGDTTTGASAYYIYLDIHVSVTSAIVLYLNNIGFFPFTLATTAPTVGATATAYSNVPITTLVLDNGGHSGFETTGNISAGGVTSLNTNPLNFYSLGNSAHALQYMPANGSLVKPSGTVLGITNASTTTYDGIRLISNTFEFLSNYNGSVPFAINSDTVYTANLQILNKLSLGISTVFPSNLNPQTPLATSIAEFNSAYSTLTIGTGATGDSPTLTFYRSSGTGSVRNGYGYRFTGDNVGGFKFQSGQANTNYGSETYTDVIQISGTTVTIPNSFVANTLSTTLDLSVGRDLTVSRNVTVGGSFVKAPQFKISPTLIGPVGATYASLDMYPNVPGYYAIGVNSNEFWLNSGQSFRFYNQGNLTATLDGSGNFTPVGTIKASNIENLTTVTFTPAASSTNTWYRIFTGGNYAGGRLRFRNPAANTGYNLTYLEMLVDAPGWGLQGQITQLANSNYNQSYIQAVRCGYNTTSGYAFNNVIDVLINTQAQVGGSGGTAVQPLSIDFIGPSWTETPGSIVAGGSITTAPSSGYFYTANYTVVNNQFGSTAGVPTALLSTPTYSGATTPVSPFASQDFVNQAITSVRSHANISGGGTISFLTVSGTNYLKWSNRFIIIANGNSYYFSTAGYFDIYMPSVGTVIPGVGGAPSVTVTTDGIALGSWTALYYVLPLSGTNTTVGFCVATYTNTSVIPPHWLLICLYNNDANTLKFSTGAIIKPGQTYDATQPSASGLGTAGQVAYFNSTSNLTSDVNFAWSSSLLTVTGQILATNNISSYQNITAGNTITSPALVTTSAATINILTVNNGTTLNSGLALISGYAAFGHSYANVATNDKYSFDLAAQSNISIGEGAASGGGVGNGNPTLTFRRTDSGRRQGGAVRFWLQDSSENFAFQANNNTNAVYGSESNWIDIWRYVPSTSSFNTYLPIISSTSADTYLTLKSTASNANTGIIFNSSYGGVTHTAQIQADYLGGLVVTPAGAITIGSTLNSSGYFFNVNGTTQLNGNTLLNGTLSQNASVGIANSFNANAGNSASTSSSNPGVLVYGPSNNYYGMSLINNNSQYKLGVFANGGYIGFGNFGSGASQSSFAEYVTFSPTGVAIGKNGVAPVYALDIVGDAFLTGGIYLNNGTHKVGLIAPTLTADSVYALPAARPTATGYVLTSDTSGNMSWILNGSGGGGGAATSLTVGTTTATSGTVGQALVVGSGPVVSQTTGGSSGQFLQYVSTSAIPIWANAVTSVAAGAGLTGTTITTTGTHSIDFTRVNTWTGGQTFSGGFTVTGTKSILAPSTGTYATLSLPSSAGTSPSTPSSGDFWFDGSHLYFYNGSVTKDLLAAGGGTVTSVTATSPLASTGGTAPVVSLGTITVAYGGTGLTSFTAANMVLASSSTSAIAAVAAPSSNGQYLGYSGGVLSWSTPPTGGAATSVGIGSTTATSGTLGQVLVVGSGPVVGQTTGGSANQFLQYVSTSAIPVWATAVTSVGASGALASSGSTTPNITLNTTSVSAGSYGSAAGVATFTVDAYGRLTAAGTTTIAITEGQVSGLSADLGNRVLTSTTVTGTNGLSGGGALSASVTLSLDVTHANSWTGAQSFSGGLTVSGTTTTLAAPTTGHATLNLPASASISPSAPGSGDLWFDGSHLYFNNGIVSKDLLTSTGGVTSVNSQSGALTVTAGTGITVGTSGTTITITATGTSTAGGIGINATAVQNSPAAGAVLYVGSNAGGNLLQQTAAGTSSTQFLQSGVAGAPTWATAVTSVSSGAGLTGTVTTTGSLAIDFTRANTWTGQQSFTTKTTLFAQSAAGYASLNVPSGAAVTAPNTGDVWFDGSHLYFQTAGGAKDLFIGSGGTVTSVGASSPLSSSGGNTPTISLGTVTVGNGGTGITGFSTANMVLASSSTSAVGALTAPTTSGQYLGWNGLSLVWSTPPTGGAASSIGVGSTTATSGVVGQVLVVGTGPIVAQTTSGTLGQFLQYVSTSAIPIWATAVTSVGASAPIATSGGPSPTISLNVSGITAGTYGTQSTTPYSTVDVYGRVTGITNTSIQIAQSQVTGLLGTYLPFAGGTLTGNLTLNTGGAGGAPLNFQTASAAPTTAAAGQMWFDGTDLWINRTASSKKKLTGRPFYDTLLRSFNPPAGSSYYDTDVYILPYSAIDGTTSVTYTARKIIVRCEGAPTSAVTLNLQVYTGTGAMPAYASGTNNLLTNDITMPASAFEPTGTYGVTFRSSTLNSNDKVRVVFTSAVSGATNFTVTLLAEEGA